MFFPNTFIPLLFPLLHLHSHIGETERQGPAFLLQPPSEWPVTPASCPPPDDSVELKRSPTCGITTTGVNPAVPNTIQFNAWKELLDATVQGLHGAGSEDGKPSAAC